MAPELRSSRRTVTDAVTFTSGIRTSRMAPARATSSRSVSVSIYLLPSTQRRVILPTLSMVRPPGKERLGRLTSSSDVIVAGSVSVSIGEVCARLHVVSSVLLAMMLSTRGHPLASILVAVVRLTSSTRKNGKSPRTIEPRGLKPLSEVFAECLLPPRIISSASSSLLKSSKWNASDISDRSMRLIRPGL